MLFWTHDPHVLFVSELFLVSKKIKLLTSVIIGVQMFAFGPKGLF